MESKLKVTDARTNESIDLPVEERAGDDGYSAVSAMELRKLKTEDDSFGVLSYDPSFGNTASTKSAITFIDGDKGLLRYRGYPIDQLAENSSMEEVAYLLLNGELPSAAAFAAWNEMLKAERANYPSQIDLILERFPVGTHPMSMLIAGLAALGSYNQDSAAVRDAEVRKLHIARLIALMPSLGASIGRRAKIDHSFEYQSPQYARAHSNDYSYAGYFLAQLGITEPVFERALDVLFILHADHEQNCSASAMRGIGSAETDPYSSAAGAAAALFGPLHGGANEAVLRMLAKIETVENVPGFIAGVKEKREKLMGFGHRVYKNYDPRAKVIKHVVDQVLEVAGPNPQLQIAQELERIALEDDYFVSRKLYPNVDFYSGIAYKAMGFDPRFFTVLFAIPRMTGWLAQWQEMLEDPEQKIARPRQLYTGSPVRDYVAADER